MSARSCFVGLGGSVMRLATCSPDRRETTSRGMHDDVGGKRVERLEVMQEGILDEVAFLDSGCANMLLQQHPGRGGNGRRDLGPSVHGYSFVDTSTVFKVHVSSPLKAGRPGTGALSVLRLALALVGLLEVAGGFFLRALGVVLGADGLGVLVDGALALAGDVEDLAQVEVGPDLGPLGLEIAVEGLAELVGRRLEIVLEEIHLATR